MEYKNILTVVYGLVSVASAYDETIVNASQRINSQDIAPILSDSLIRGLIGGMGGTVANVFVIVMFIVIVLYAIRRFWR